MSSCSGNANLLSLAIFSGLYISCARIGHTVTGGSISVVRSPLAEADGCGMSKNRS